MLAAIRLFFITLLLGAVSSAQSVIHLKTGDIETDPDQIVTEIVSPNPRGVGHLLVQFNEHPTAATLQALQLRGIQVLGGVPDNGLLVSLERSANIAPLGAHSAQR